MVSKSKKMDVNEMIKPNIINGLDLKFSSFLCLLFIEDKLLSFFFKIRLGKGLIMIKSKNLNYLLIVLNKSLW